MNPLVWLRLRRATVVRRPQTATRGDIQGLRAVAVLLVISSHVFDQPRGGFVGVDMFFVLSGFLITQLLLREHGRSGRISFADFYRRRVRRIVPVATLVLAATVVATFVLVNEGRGRTVTEDALWAFGFLANVHFADVGTDYFAAGGPVSPLQHYWSLSVEEQFYVGWPALVLVGLWVAARGVSTERRRTVTLLALALGVTAVSFAYSLVQSSSDPVAAYFSTAGRAWELTAGATLAVCAGLLAKIPAGLRPVLAWGGVVTVALSVVTISATSTFPAPAAALPVAGTMLVLAAGTGREPRFLLPLSNPVTRYLGDISYSLYLWHFPVVVLALAYFPDGGVSYQATCLLLTLVLSVLSYHLVENPVRHSQWLEPRSRRMRPAGPTNHSTAVANGWLAVGLVVAVLMSMLVLRTPGGAVTAPVLAAEAPAPAPSADTGEEQSLTPDGDYLRERIEQTLDLDDFPALSPGVEDLGIGPWFEEAREYGCSSVSPERAAECRFGDREADKSVVVIGDSFAIAYMPMIREALGDYFSIQQLTMHECPPFDLVSKHFDGSAFPECQQYKEYVLDEIARQRPDIVLVVSSYAYSATPQSLASGAEGEAALEEIEPALGRVLAEVAESTQMLAVLAAPPGAGNLQACVTAVGEPSDCEATPSPVWEDFSQMQQDVVAAAAPQNGAFIESEDWFCADGRCPGFVGTTPVYADSRHVTNAYARELGPAFFEALIAAALEVRERLGLDVPGKGKGKGRTKR